MGVQEGLAIFSPDQVRANMIALRNEAYPGRFIAAGIGRPDTVDESVLPRRLHVVTAIMGRRPSSQTRTYELNDDGDVLSVPFGEDVDPLTAYKTMADIGPYHIATNGSQTDALAGALDHHSVTTHTSGLNKAREVLLGQHHEPDTSHTPRISLVVAAGKDVEHQPALFSIIRNDPADPENEKRSKHRFYKGYLGSVLARGTGLSLTTYEGDGDPLVPFEGGPRPITVGRTAEETAAMIADVLDANGGFLVSVAAKVINLSTGETEEVARLNKYGPEPNYVQNIG